MILQRGKGEFACNALYVMGEVAEVDFNRTKRLA